MSASTIHEYAFNQQTAESAGDLFPPQIAEDSWIAYHGTSAIYEHSIDSEGIQPRSSGASSELVESVKELYRTMCWWGEDTGGYGVLYAFVPHSQWHDRPVFLAESSYRALLYATSDFAGGEIARGVRRAIADLQRYVGDSEVRQRHAEWLANYSEPKSSFLLPWLQNEVEGLKERASHCIVPNAEGVVYAVRFSAGDLPHLRLHKSAGLMALRAIPPSQLVAKVRIPASMYGVTWWRTTVELRRRWHDGDSGSWRRLSRLS